MLSSLRSSRTAVPWFLLGGLMVAGCTDSTAPGPAPAPAVKLAFMMPPSNAMKGAAISPPVQVAAEDAYGNLVTGFQGSVTVALGGNPAPGALSGTRAVRAIGGVATFSDLSIAPVSPGYTLTASAAGLTGATSTPFSIVPSGGRCRDTSSGCWDY
jgi:hypothetical protein